MGQEARVSGNAKGNGWLGAVLARHFSSLFPLALIARLT